MKNCFDFFIQSSKLPLLWFSSSILRYKLVFSSRVSTHSSSFPQFGVSEISIHGFLSWPWLTTSYLLQIWKLKILISRLVMTMDDCFLMEVNDAKPDVGRVMFKPTFTSTDDVGKAISLVRPNIMSWVSWSAFPFSRQPCLTLLSSWHP